MLFIGAGSMAEAIIKGIVGTNPIVLRKNLWAYDIKRERLEEIQRQYSINVCLEADEQYLNSIHDKDVIVLAVKPADADTALRHIAQHAGPHNIVLSIMAGISIDYIMQRLTKCHRIARVMPNTAALVGEAMSAVTYSPGMDAEDHHIVETILSCLGDVVEIPESSFDAVTALSGSGPAYIFYVAEIMIEAGKQMGLSAELSKRLTIQTIYGAATMMKRDTATDPSVFRAKVTSPNGTTHAAITHLIEKELQHIFIEALHKAKKRSEELGK